MKQIFYLAGGLLGVSGFLHIALLAASMAESALVAGLFGLAYLVISFFLMRRSDAAVTAGLAAAFLGLLAAVLGIKSGPALFNTIFLVIDAAVLAICGYLYITGRATLRRVR